MADTTAWITAVRASHDRFAGLVGTLSDVEIEAPSYATDWSIAQVASHLGSQAEIFALILDAGLASTPAPGGEEIQPIWDRWNALTPAQQVQESVRANEKFVQRVEDVSAEDRERFSVFLFGSQQDFRGLLSMRLGEHAVHTWDIAVARDDSATVLPQAVELLIDVLPPIIERAGVAAPGSPPVSIVTTRPDRAYLLTLDPEVALEPSVDTAADALTLPAEAFLRLVYGRLDPDHTPAGLSDERLPVLRTVFPGF